MTDFVASNGIRVYLDEHGGVEWSGGSRLGEPKNVVTQAFREFFQAERDSELGRWRSKEHPEYVAYPKHDGSVRVVLEATGEGADHWRNRESGVLMGAAVAREWFAAHPEPKSFPSEPGAYNDAHGILTTLDPNGVWRGMYGGLINPNLLTLPLTRLVPKEK